MQQTKHSIHWFRIPVRDLTKATAFYGAVVGRPLKLVDFGGRPHAVFQSVGESAVTGALGEEPKGPAIAPLSTALQGPPAEGPPYPGREHSGVTIFLDVDAVTAALARAVEAGGKVIQPVTDLGPQGTCARIEDLDGNVIGLHTGKA